MALRARAVFAVSLTALLAVQTGCGAKRTTSGLTTAAPAPAAAAAPAPETVSVADQAEKLWAEREDPAKLKEAIAQYEKAFQADPANKTLATRIARGTYFLADAYTDNPEEKLAGYEKAAFFGERALALNPAFKAKIDSGVEVKDALDTLEKSDAEALYWTASAIGKWSRLKGFSTVVKNKAQISGMATRFTELEPNLFYGGPPRYWGSYYAVAPSFAGGDLNKSREFFEKSLAAEPNYFGTKVLMAELYAVKTQDKALFDKLLNEVASGDPAVLPDIVPEQKVEQKKAKDLMARKADLFAD